MLSAGCDLVGVANVEKFREAPEGRRPVDILPTARSVVVGAVHILDSVCDDLPQTRYEYTNQFYVLNGTLGSASTKVGRLLEDQGYRAAPIPAAYPRINKELMGVFSHRHAAVLAGLGGLGLNNLLYCQTKWVEFLLPEGAIPLMAGQAVSPSKRRFNIVKI